MSVELCSDCPPEGYPTDKTRCIECPRRPLSDCENDGCGECDVCLYLNHLEYAAAVMPSNGDMSCTVERDERIERLLDQKYPHWRGH